MAELVERLPQLQSLIKRDPDAYADEFDLQLRNFSAELEIFQLKPSSDSKPFRELVTFMSHVAPCYPKKMAEFPLELMKLVQEHATILQPEVRKTLVQNVMMLRNRGMIDAVPMLKLFFELFRVQDKVLRELLMVYIINDVKNTNRHKQNERVNRSVQTFLFGMLKDENSTAAKRSLDVMIALYKKRVWTDARTVNVMATACTSNVPKLCVAAMKFFLGVEMEDERDEEDEIKEVKSNAPSRHSKHTRARLRKADEVIAKVKRIRARGNREKHSFPAIQLLHDPQGLAENLLRKLKSAKDRFEVRLIMMNLISRLIGQHKLICLPFYSFVQRYMSAYQANVTQIMAYLAQACHELVPPNELVPVVKAIANHFVVDKVPPEAIQVGLNGLRAVIVRTPLLLEEPGIPDLVSDLVLYRKFRNKGVVSAARSFLNAVRELHPTLLRRRDRGRDHDPDAKPLMFGELNAAEMVDGVQLLAEAEAAGTLEEEEGEDEWAHDEGADDSEEDDSDLDDMLDRIPGMNRVGDYEEQMPDEDGDEEDGGSVARSEGPSEAAIEAARQRIMARVLTPRDFARIEQLKADRLSGGKRKRGGRVSKMEQEMTSGVHRDDAVNEVDESDLEGSAARKRRRAMQRLADAKADQLEWQLKSHGGGTTNAEKRRSKNFLMLRKSVDVQRKQKRSLKSQAKNLRKHRKNMERQGKHAKRRRK